MGELNLAIDMGRVQSSVAASIRPAVEAALAEYDVAGAIKEALSKPAPGSRSMSRMMWVGVHGFDSEPTSASMLDGMVQDSIREMATHFIQSEMAARKDEIHEAFRKMMLGSSNKLAKAFAAATERALDEAWSFDLKVEVEHSELERTGDDD